MDHAEARERIADLALEPRRLVDLETDPTPDERAILAHATECPACHAELDAWRKVHALVLMATADDAAGDDAADSDPDDTAEAAMREPPSWLRGSVAAIPGRSPRLLVPQDTSAPADSSAQEGRRWSRWQLSGLAAVIVFGLVIGAGALAVDQARQADAARSEAAQLAELSSTVDRVLREAGHTAIPLAGLDGAPAGTAAWSSGEIVVMTAALTPPGHGGEYRCWIERDGRRTAIGVMRFADGIAYWSGPLDRYGDLSLDGGGRLGVSLEVPGEDGGGAPVLVGVLPS